MKTIENSSNIMLYFIFLLFICIEPIARILANFGKIPLINIQYIIAASLIFIIVIKVIIAFKTNKIRFGSISYFIGFLVLIYIVAIQVLAYAFVVESIYEIYIYRRLLISTLFGSILFWLVGSNIIQIYDLLNRRHMKIFTVALYFIYSFMIVYAVIQGTTLTSSIFSFQMNSAIFSDYLSYADKFAVYSIMMLFLIFQNSWLRAVLLIFSVCILYATISRTAFFFYIIATVPLTIFSISSIGVLIIIIALFLIIINLLIAYINNDNALFNRMFIVITDRTLDQSYIERQWLFEQGLNDLKKNWFLGTFMLEVKMGRPGGYIHNYLSFWVSYGILPFIGFVVSAVSSFMMLIKKFIQNRNDPLLQFAVSYSIFCFASIIASRSYTWPYVWLAISAMPQVVKYISLSSKGNNEQ
jgi:hypothetical protein